MKKLNNYFISIFLLLANIVVPAIAMATPSQELLSISVASLSLEERERIVGFQVNIKAGRIVNLPVIPFGWNIIIDNDPSWSTKIIGSTIVGSAALGIDSLKDFIVIEKHEFMGLNFGIEAEIIVTTDFEKERHIRLETKDLMIKRV
jgi:hypothetical protein